MELRHIRYFLALSNELNFTKAAEKVHVTQSTLSHQISQLEEELGIALFERTLKKVELTHAGQQFLQCAIRAMKELDSGVRALKTSGTPVSGNVTVGTTHVGFLLRPLALFMERYPFIGIRLQELTASALEERVANETLDVGIGLVPFASRQLWAEPLFSESLVLVVSRDHPLANRKRLRMLELHQQPLVLLSPEFETRNQLDAALKELGAEPKVVAELNSLRAIIHLLRLRPVGTIVSDLVIPSSPEFRKIPLLDPTISRKVALLWKKNKQYSRAAEEFAALLKASTKVEKKLVFEMWPVTGAATL